LKNFDWYVPASMLPRFLGGILRLRVLVRV